MIASPQSRPDRHRNSLGYVISERSLGKDSDQPMIVWGRADDGTRVAIADAERGGAQGLKCECGSLLVAKKGSVKAHHFAHSSDGAAACQKAHHLALCHFAANALAGGVSLQVPGRHGNLKKATVETATVREFGDVVGVQITAAGKPSGRELAIVFSIRDTQGAPSDQIFEALGISALLIDLTDYRNMADEQIVSAIRSRARRSWIFNARFPDLANHVGDMNERSRIPIAFAEAWETRPSDPMQRPGHITDEEWRTLPPEELRRRLFGSKYERRRR